MEKCVAYFRTSSLANVGNEKDSLKRQRKACLDFALQNNLEIVKEFYDAGVKGKDLLQDRPGFSELLDFSETVDVKTIVFETASRFSREIVVQELGWKELTQQGFQLICTDAPGYFSASDVEPSRKMIRQILGVVSEFQKDELVAKLVQARKRKEQVNKEKGYLTLSGRGKCAGRKSWKELNGDVIKLSKKLARKNPKSGQRRSRMEIARILLKHHGYGTASGRPFGHEQVKRFLKC